VLIKKTKKDGKDVDQRSIRRSGYTSGKKTYVTNDDLFESEDYDHVWPSRMPSSTRRYRSDVKTDLDYDDSDVEVVTEYPTTRPGRKSSVPARSTATQAQLPVVQSSRRRAVDTDDVQIRHDTPVQHEGPRFHWLFYAGVVMLVMIAGWVALSYLSNWSQVTWDDLHYGRPRTYQTDQVVGHNDSRANPSHFIALNLNRHVEVIEFPGGDPAKAKVYVVGPTLIGPGQDLTPVTLTFKDVNGDGKPDMIVNIQDTRLVFINENGAFRPLHSGENVQL
jgi:hypothetical protein